MPGLFTQRRDQPEILAQRIAGEQVANLAAGIRDSLPTSASAAGSSQPDAPAVRGGAGRRCLRRTMPPMRITMPLAT